MTTLDEMGRQFRAALEKDRIEKLTRRYAAWLWLERHTLGVCTFHGGRAGPQYARWSRALPHPRVRR